MPVPKDKNLQVIKAEMQMIVTNLKVIANTTKNISFIRFAFSIFAKFNCYSKYRLYFIGNRLVRCIRYLLGLK